MDDGEFLALINLHQRKAGAWRLKPRVAANMADERTRERGFPRAQIARQRHKIALSHKACHLRGKVGCRRLVWQFEAPCRRICRLGHDARS